jgi:hypothetical protein
MAEDWEKLAADWEGHAVALIAEVDCTSDGGQPICEDFEVQVRYVTSLLTFWRRWMDSYMYYCITSCLFCVSLEQYIFFFLCVARCH